MVRRISFGRRLELTRRVRDLAKAQECRLAGSGDLDKLEAAILAAEVDRIYFEFGLVEVAGLEIDGQPATITAVLDAGPEGLTQEILRAIKAESGLSPAERKN